MKKVMFISLLIFISTIIAQDNFNKDYLTFEVRPCEPGEDLASPQMELYNTRASFLIYDPVCLTNEDIDSTAVVIAMDGPSVFVKLTDKGKKKFYECTQINEGLNAAIIIDNVLVSAPVIQEKINSGQLIITGNLTEQEAENIAKGILPKKND